MKLQWNPRWWYVASATITTTSTVLHVTGCWLWQKCCINVGSFWMHVHIFPHKPQCEATNNELIVMTVVGDSGKEQRRAISTRLITSNIFQPSYPSLQVKCCSQMGLGRKKLFLPTFPQAISFSPWCGIKLALFVCLLIWRDSNSHTAGMHD